MRKIITLSAIFAFSVSLSFGQHVDLKQVIPIPFTNISGYSSPNGICDTLNIFDANSWTAYYYEYRGGGAVLGTNNLTATKAATILEDANLYDVSADNYKYISGGLVYFAYANSDVPANLINKDVIFKLYDDAGGHPGTVLASTTKTLGDIHDDVAAGRLTEFKFSSSIAIPSSKKFYISVDHSNFVWKHTNHDSLAIVGTENHSTANTTFQYIDENSNPQWFSSSSFWRNSSDSLVTSLFIFPFVSTTESGCEVLPVSIFNFGGTIKDYQAYLNWSTASENNNKGFYVERSKDGQNFSSVGFVNGAGNSTQIKNYSYVDASLKDMNVTTTFYRLKQVDNDGKYAYSNVLSLNLKDNVQWRIYPNPVKDATTIEMNLSAASKVNVQVISRDGRIIMNADKGLLSQGKQLVPLNAQGLAKGSYIVRLTIGDKHYSLPFVKE